MADDNMPSVPKRYKVTPDSEQYQITLCLPKLGNTTEANDGYGKGIYRKLKMMWEINNNKDSRK